MPMPPHSATRSWAASHTAWAAQRGAGWSTRPSDTQSVPVHTSVSSRKTGGGGSPGCSKTNGPSLPPWRTTAPRFGSQAAARKASVVVVPGRVVH